MFHHRTNVFSYRANPWQKTALSSIAEPLDPSHCGSTEFRYLYVWFIYDSLSKKYGDSSLFSYISANQWLLFYITELQPCYKILSIWNISRSWSNQAHYIIFPLYFRYICFRTWCISHRFKNWHHPGHCKHHQPVTKYEAIGVLMK